MPEDDSLGPPDPGLLAILPPWTNPGPNEPSKQQEVAGSSTTATAADPIFTLKNRVITMKQLEALKKICPQA